MKPIFTVFYTLKIQFQDKPILQSLDNKILENHLAQLSITCFDNEVLGMFSRLTCTYCTAKGFPDQDVSISMFFIEIILGITLCYSLSSMYGISDSENGGSGISYLWESDRGGGISGSEY